MMVDGGRCGGKVGQYVIETGAEKTGMIKYKPLF
jgi:hypothetical protein